MGKGFLFFAAWTHLTTLEVPAFINDFDEVSGGLKIVSSIKKIEIPEFPGAHNPSLVRVAEGYLLTFRYTPNLYFQPTTSYVGIVLLNDDFVPVTEAQILNTRSKNSKTPSQSEDARIFSYREKLFLIYNDNIEQFAPGMSDRRDMFLAELYRNESEYLLSPPLKLTYRQKYYTSWWQKNWVPFEYDGTLLISYMLNPHEVIYPNLANGDCYFCYETPVAMDWEFGVLRGGTPAMLADGEYLAFFHSSIPLASNVSSGHCLYHYFMGAYTFAPSPPFRITKMTEFPIIDQGFYTQSDYYKRVVFPGGFVVSDSQIILAYGKDDREIWIAILDKAALKKALTPLQTPKGVAR